MTARKKSTAPTRIWSFGARLQDDPDNVDRAWGLLRGATDYANVLIGLHGDHLARYRTIREEHVPELIALREQVEAAIGRCEHLVALGKRLRKLAKTDPSAAPTKQEWKASLDEAREAKKEAVNREREARFVIEADLDEARTELKRRIAARCGPSTARTVGPRTVETATADERVAMRAESDWPALWRDLDAEDERYLRAQKTARAESGLPHGCYALVDEAVKQAIKEARPELPKRRNLSKPARLGVQVPGQVTWSDVVSGACSRVRVAPAPPALNRHGRPLKTGKCPMRQIGIRVSTRPDVYVYATFKLHREPPPDAQVKWAWIRIRRVGARLACEVQFTLESPAFATSSRPAGVGHVSITPCCVLSADGIAVATWKSDDGQTGEIVIPRTPAATGGRGTCHSLLARLVYQEAWSSALDTAHATALEVLAPGEMSRSFPARRGLERLIGWWCRDRWDRATLSAWWQQWRRDRLNSGLHLLDRPSAGEELDGWWPRQTEAWLRGVLPDATDADVRAWWAWTWTRQMAHLTQERARIRDRAREQRDAHFRRSGIELATRFDTATIHAPRIASEKRRRSQHAPALREVLQLVGVATCADIVREVFGVRVSKGTSGELVADDGKALREVLTRAAAESGQVRRTHRRRPERERSGGARTSGGARSAGKAAGRGVSTPGK